MMVWHYLSTPTGAQATRCREYTNQVEHRFLGAECGGTPKGEIIIITNPAPGDGGRLAEPNRGARSGGVGAQHHTL